MERNIELIKNDAMNSITHDVVLVGDSITEHWQGTGLSKTNHEDIKEVYDELFRQPDGIKGLALGISGDRVSYVCHMNISRGRFATANKNVRESVRNSCIDCEMAKCLHPFNPRCGGS